MRRTCVVVVALQCVLVTLHALARPVVGWDAWSIWTLKARVFYIDQTIPAAYFHDLSRLFSHPDYPLLVSLVDTWIFGWLGQPDAWAMMVVFPIFFLGVVACVAGLLMSIYDATAGLLGAVVLVCVPLLLVQASSGDADVPLTLMATASTVFLWRWIDEEEDRQRASHALVFCGLLAGLAAWTKKEGLLLLVVTALVVAVAAWRRHMSTVHTEQRRFGSAWRATGVDALFFLVPALLVAGPWLLVLTLERPLTRDFLPFTPATLLAHVDRVPAIAIFVGLRLLDVSRWNVVWIALAAAVVLRRRYLHGPLAYLLALLVLQIASDGLVFIFSDWQPYTLHLQTAFDRLLLHSLPVAVFLLVALVVGEKGPVSGADDQPIRESAVVLTP